MKFRAIMKVKRNCDIIGSASSWTESVKLYANSKKKLKKKIKTFKQCNQTAWLSECIEYKEVRISL